MANWLGETMQVMRQANFAAWRQDDIAAEARRVRCDCGRAIEGGLCAPSNMTALRCGGKRERETVQRLMAGALIKALYHTSSETVKTNADDAEKERPCSSCHLFYHSPFRQNSLPPLLCRPTKFPSSAHANSFLCVRLAEFRPECGEFPPERRGDLELFIANSSGVRP